MTFSARELGLDPNRGGRWSNRHRLHDQIERLFNASISFAYTGERHRQWLNMEVTSKGEMWWDFKQPAQADLFSSWIELGEQFKVLGVYHNLRVEQVRGGIKITPGLSLIAAP